MAKSGRKMLFLLFWGALSLVYLWSRLLFIRYLNEYVDYDEGTYLLMARLINQGHLLYRDIFAVHPPLYYYILAVWLRLFGDSYVVGRLLSVFIGGLAVVLAYFIGKELRNEKLGILFALLLVLDPTILRINRLVLHDTFIEFFVLFSMYYLVKYQKTRNVKYAYISLALAGIGSTVKFTIIPYVSALYLAILLMSLDSVSWGYVRSGIKTVLSTRQVFVVLTLYLILAASMVALRMAWPSWITRDIIVLLGIHPFSKVGHKYIGGFIVVSWALLNIYIFNCQYVGKLFYIFRDGLRNLKLATYLALAVLIPKGIIEFSLGYAVSPDYLYQTYLLQSSRYFSFAAVFELSSEIIHYFHVGPHELAHAFVPTFILLAFLLMLLLKGGSPKNDEAISFLFLMNSVMYLLLFPIIPNVRFLVPLFLTFYLFILDTIISSGNWLTHKRLISGVVISVILLSMTNYGFLVNLPHGELNIAWGVHTTELREDTKLYLTGNPCGMGYSINPMNTYYFNLHTVPWIVDSFGLLYMAGFSPENLISTLIENNVNCVILSTWVYEITKRNSKLAMLYHPLERYLLVNGTPLFSESYSHGDFISVFLLGTEQRNLTVTSKNGMLVIFYNATEIMEVYPRVGDQNFNERATLQGDGEVYIVTWYSETGEHVEANLTLAEDYIRIEPKNNDAEFILDFNGIATDEVGEVPSLSTPEKYLNVYVDDTRLYLKGSPLYYDGKGIVRTGEGSSVEIGRYLTHS